MIKGSFFENFQDSKIYNFLVNGIFQNSCSKEHPETTVSVQLISLFYQFQLIYLIVR